jgi:hypothetical protein
VQVAHSLPLAALRTATPHPISPLGAAAGPGKAQQLEEDTSHLGSLSPVGRANESVNDGKSNHKNVFDETATDVVLDLDAQQQETLEDEQLNDEPVTPGGNFHEQQRDEISAQNVRPLRLHNMRGAGGGGGSARVLKSSRPPSPYLSTLLPSGLSSRASTAHSRQMGLPQTGSSSFMLSSCNMGFSKRPSSVSSQASDEPRRLLDAKVLRKRSDQDYQLMINRVNRLRLEAARTHKNMMETRERAEDVVRLKAQNELRARAKEHARMLQEQLLARQRQQKTLARAHLHASIMGARQRVHMHKRHAVEHCRTQRQALAKEAWEARKGEEERAARLKHHIYTQERQAVCFFIFCYVFFS